MRREFTNVRGLFFVRGFVCKVYCDGKKKLEKSIKNGGIGT